MQKLFIKISALSLSGLLSGCLSTTGLESNSCRADPDDEILAKQQQELFAISEAGDWGFIDVNGHTVITPRFEAVSRFSEGLAAFKATDERWGYINTKGEIVIDPVFDAAFPFYEQRAVVTVDGKQGFIDENGAFILRPFYTQVARFSQGRAFVLIGGSWKLINQDGDYVTDNSFRQVNIFREGLASFVGFNSDYDKRGYINRNGEIEILLENELFVDIEGLGFSYRRAPIFRLESFSLIHIFSSNAQRERIYGLINQSGELIVTPQYNFIDTNSECMAIVSSKDRYGAIDLNGNTVIPMRYSHLEEFSEGLALAQRRQGQKYGYINLKGQFVIEPIQEINSSVSANPNPNQETTHRIDLPSDRNFYRGRALFKDASGKYGYIDMSGELVIDPIFDTAFPFRDADLAKFENRREWGYVNTDGTIVWRSEKNIGARQVNNENE